MSIIIRTDEEIEELQNQSSEAFDDGSACASLAMEILDWLTDKDAPKPQFV